MTESASIDLSSYAPPFTFKAPKKLPVTFISVRNGVVEYVGPTKPAHPETRDHKIYQSPSEERGMWYEFHHGSIWAGSRHECDIPNVVLLALAVTT